MANPSVEERLGKLLKARDTMKELLGAPDRFARECESAFAEFRVRCVHLRREREALDSVEDKDQVWRYICQFSKASPFHNNRCKEVLEILMLSDAWMKAFAEDPETKVEDLPPDIADQIRKRCDEVEEGPGGHDKGKPESGGGKPQGASPEDSPPPPSLSFNDPRNMAIVVQRCAAAKISGDPKAPTAGIGPGLIVNVSVADGATLEGVSAAARFILTAKLSGPNGWMPNGHRVYGSGAESIVSLCKRGEAQGIMVVPQASLVAQLGEDHVDLVYQGARSRQNARDMYDAFVEELKNAAPELIAAAPEPESGGLKGLFQGRKGSCLPQVVAGEFGGQQFLEMRSAGPFMHSFNF